MQSQAQIGSGQTGSSGLAGSSGQTGSLGQTGSGQTGSLGPTGSSAVDLVQHELSLLHAELMFEKQRREVHARRSRRLLARINQLNSFADHNDAMVRDNIVHVKPTHTERENL